MAGSVGIHQISTHRHFKQYYPQTLELTFVYNSVSLHVFTKWEEKGNF